MLQKISEAPVMFCCPGVGDEIFLKFLQFSAEFFKI